MEPTKTYNPALSGNPQSATGRVYPNGNPDLGYNLPGFICELSTLWIEAPVQPDCVCILSNSTCLAASCRVTSAGIDETCVAPAMASYGAASAGHSTFFSPIPAHLAGSAESAIVSTRCR